MVVGKADIVCCTIPARAAQATILRAIGSSTNGALPTALHHVLIIITFTEGMKGITMIRTLSAVAISAAAFAALAGQQSPGTKPPSTPPPAQKPPEPPPAEMQDPNAAPGEVHKGMAMGVGEYTTKTKMTMAGAEPMESTGTSKLSMSLDGRFLTEEANETMMGEQVKTIKISGYNNGSKEYEAVWMYTMSTAMMRLTGTSDDNGKTIKWKGTYKEADGEHTLSVLTTHVDANTMIEKIYEADGEKDGPVMETTYTRKK